MTFQRCDVCKRAEEGHKRKVRTTLQTVVTSAWVGQARLKWVLEMVMGTWATKAQEREREKKKKTGQDCGVWVCGLGMGSRDTSYSSMWSLTALPGTWMATGTTGLGCCRSLLCRGGAWTADPMQFFVYITFIDQVYITFH